MIKIHKLEDGDIIKILPMIDKNDKISWIKTYDCAFVGTSTIYDNSGKSYLKRISHKLRDSKLIHHSSTKLQIATRHGMNIYIDGEIRILNVTKTLFEMIINNKKLLDIRGNHQLFVVKKEVSAGGGQVFPSFDHSYVSEKSWTPPVVDINSKEEWYSYIKSNQPDFDTHIEKNNIFSQKQLLVNLLGTDMLAELISDDREKKLDKLGV
jgi:hypothetical protein